MSVLLLMVSCVNHFFTKVIISIGINDRGMRAADLRRNFSLLIDSCDRMFKNCVFVQVNFSETLRRYEKNTLLGLNSYISERCKKFVSPVPSHLFLLDPTDRARIHWSRATGQVMVNHWKDSILV